MRQIGNPGLIHLAAGVPDVSLLPVKELQLAHERAVRLSRGRCFAYQSPEGDPQLRACLAEHLENRGVECPRKENDVLLTVGATEALRLALRLLVSSGQVVACESPCYYNLLEQVDDLGAKILPVPTDLRKGLQAEVLESYLQKYRPVCLVSCSSLSNPAGSTIPESEREKVVKCCRRYGVKIIEDEVYGELRDAGPLPPLRAFDDGSTVLYLTSFCKSVAPGLRVGFLLPGPYYEQACAMRCLEIMHASTLTESILREFLVAGAMRPHLKRMGRELQLRRGLLHREIGHSFPEGTLCSEPEGGFLMWVVLPGKVDSLEFYRRCLRREVSLARGEVFLTGTPTRTCFRLNVARASREELKAGARILGEEAMRMLGGG